MKHFVTALRLAFLPFCVVTLTTMSSSVAGIVIRHDVADSKYIEAGKPFIQVAPFNGGTCTLISPQWVLTAGHVAADWNPFASTIEFNGKRYAIEKVVVHPTYLTGGVVTGEDVALVKLKQAVDGVTPVDIYTGSDELGKTVTFVGYGDTGDGRSGPTKSDGLRRAAQNVVTKTEGTYIQFVFDSPDKAVPLEGISGPGDSGGPALIDVGGKLFTIGISSQNRAPMGMVCRYSSVEVYARVSSSAGWIKEAIQKDIPPTTRWKDPVDADKFDFKSSVKARIVAAYVKALNTGSPAEVEKFNHEFRSDQFLGTSDRAGRLERAKGTIERYGQLVFKKVALAEDGSLSVLATSSKLKADVFIRPVFSSSQAEKVDGFIIALAS